MCPEECVAANKALETLPNAKEVACCDCGEGPVGRECNMRKMNLGAACGLDNTFECDDTTDKVGCAPVSKHGGSVYTVCVHPPLSIDLSSRP